MGGFRPNSNYLLSSVTSQDTTTCQNNATTYRKYEHTQFHSGMGTQTQTDCACIFLPLNPSSLVVPNNLASHAHVILPSHIDCISAFQDINTIKSAVTLTVGLVIVAVATATNSQQKVFRNEQ